MMTLNLFPNKEIYKNVGRGFMLVDDLSPEWLKNLMLIYGMDIVFDQDKNLTDNRLQNIIESSGDIISFLSKLVRQQVIIDSIKPEKREYTGMVDSNHKDFKEYTETWAKLIKIYVLQGAIVIGQFKSSDDGDMNKILDVDSFDVGQDKYIHTGKNKINLDAIRNLLGEDGMFALHVLFHSMDLNEFHEFLSELKDDNIIGYMLSISRASRKYIDLKDPNDIISLEWLPKSDKIDMDTYYNLNLDNPNININ